MTVEVVDLVENRLAKKDKGERMRASLLQLVTFGLVALVADRAEAWSRIHYSITGELGVGDVVYDGSSAVGPMIQFQSGVLTAFANCGGGQPACIHRSKDEKGLGAGPRVYAGSSLVASILPFSAGILTAFNGLPDPPAPGFCPMPSECVPPNSPAGILLCQKGKLAGGGNCVADGPPEPCGICGGFKF